MSDLGIRITYHGTVSERYSSTDTTDAYSTGVSVVKSLKGVLLARIEPI